MLIYFGLFIKWPNPIEIHPLQNVRQPNKTGHHLNACLKPQVQCLPKVSRKTKSLFITYEPIQY